MKVIFTLFCGMLLSMAAAENASKWGFDKNDATECLQKAIDSGAARIVVDNTGSDWIVGPIKLRSNLELVFADGVVVRAHPDAFKGRNDCMFQAWDARNIVLRGEGGAVVKMNKKDYQDASRYSHSEWRHLLSFRGCENVTIRNLKLQSSGGDGIYISTGKELPGCRNVVIEDVTATDHHRQGISIISVDGLLIRNCRFSDTEGTPPAAGIDFEPNSPGEWIAGCVIENSVFENNIVGVCVSVGALTEKSKPVSISFKNCEFKGGGPVFYSIASRTVTPAKGAVLFDGCRFSEGKNCTAMVNDLLTGGFELRFKDCLMDNRGASANAAIILSSALPVDFGGLKFENTTLITGGKSALEFNNLSGGGVADVGGILKMQRKDGSLLDFNFAEFAKKHQPVPELQNFKTASVDLFRLKPAGPGKPDARSKRFRGKFKLLQYVEADKVLELKFQARQVSKSPLNISVSVKDAAGTPLDHFKITEPEFTYTLKSNSAGVRLFEINTAGHTLELASGHPGQAILADTRTGMFVASGAEFYFAVPAGVKDIRVEIMPDIGEPVDAALISPDGKTVDSCSKNSNLTHLSYQRPDASKTEIWRLKFPYVREDFRFRLGAPLPPLVSTAPENILSAE